MLLDDEILRVMYRYPEGEDRIVKLNGRDARIVGRLNRYATVASLDGKLSGEWSWDSAAEIVRCADVQGRQAEFRL
jgi:hypothetical protein